MRKRTPRIAISHPTQTGQISFTHHLAVDQFKGLGRYPHLSAKWIIEQDDEANHGAGEKGDQAAK